MQQSNRISRQTRTVSVANACEKLAKLVRTRELMLGLLVVSHAKTFLYAKNTQVLRHPIRFENDTEEYELIRPGPLLALLTSKTTRDARWRRTGQHLEGGMTQNAN